MQAGVEHPKWGTPGVCNFIDGRTQWMDHAVERAIMEGIRQVSEHQHSTHSSCLSLTYLPALISRRCPILLGAAAIKQMKFTVDNDFVAYELQIAYKYKYYLLFLSCV